MNNSKCVDWAIEVERLSKCYQIYAKPSDRLKQMLMRGRRKYYREFWALQDVSFQVKKGETVAVIGKNGSGKSTLLQIICGTLNPTGGDVKVNGRVAALLELGAGFNSEYTGVENIYMSASLYGLNKEEIDKRFNSICEFAEIGEHIHQPVKTYSSGMYVRLAFAIIVHVDADILIIDEALSVGDAFFNQKCMKFIRSFKKNGTIIFVSHDMSAVSSLCDRAVWLNGGKIASLGFVEEVTNEYLNVVMNNLTRLVESPKKNINLPILKLSRIHDSAYDALIAKGVNYNRLNLLSSNNFHDQEFKELTCALFDSNNEPIVYVEGGELVSLIVEVKVEKTISSPILGFSIKDKNGQYLFGENTYQDYCEYDCTVENNGSIRAEFDFYMPWLKVGTYIVQVAFADGDLQDHKQICWIHDALKFESRCESISMGLIGIPMKKITLLKR